MNKTIRFLFLFFLLFCLFERIPLPQPFDIRVREAGAPPPSGKYQMTFNHLDKDNNVIDSRLTWKLYNGTQLLTYKEGEYTLVSGTYRLKTYYHGRLMNQTELPTSTYGNTTVNIYMQMKSQGHVAGGYIAFNNTISSIIINSQTRTNLTMTAIGSSPSWVIIDARRNASHLQQNEVNQSGWTYHMYTVPNYIQINLTSLSTLSLIFPSTVIPAKLTWCGASIWDLTESQFNMVFKTEPYYDAAIFVSNFVYGGKFLTAQAENFFTLADVNDIDVILAIDRIDYENNASDARTQEIMAKGYNTWQDALTAVCAHFNENHPSVKYIGIYKEFSTPTTADNVLEFVTICRSYNIEGFEWGDVSANRREHDTAALWRPRTDPTYPWQQCHGIKEPDGTSWYKGTNASTGEEWAVVKYPPLGIKVEDYVWDTMNSGLYACPQLTFAISFDYWAPSMWYSEEEVDRILRLSRRYIEENPSIPIRYVAFGSGQMSTEISQVKGHGGFCGKYNITQEGYRLRDIFGLKIGPQFHPDIIECTFNRAIEYDLQTHAPKPPVPSIFATLTLHNLNASFSGSGNPYVQSGNCTITHLSYSSNTFAFTVVGASGTTSCTMIFFPRGKPLSISGASSWNHNAVTKVTTVYVVHSSFVKVTISWDLGGGSSQEFLLL